MPSLLIPTDILKAALICASTDPTRYYINGVYVDPRGQIVATDGHRLFVANFDLCAGLPPDEKPVGFAGFIIPSDVLKKVLTGNKQIAIEVTPSVIDRLNYAPVDATFPDWRRVVPQGELTGVAAQFNPDYVADLGKIGALLGSGKKGELRAYIHHNGEAPAGVTFTKRDDCFAVIMPIRSDASASRSDWMTTGGAVVL